MRSRSRKLLAVSLLVAGALLGGGYFWIAPAPPVVEETPFGVVRATTPEDSRRIAAVLEQLVPGVRDALPDMRRQHIEVWVQKRPHALRGLELEDGWPAMTVRGLGILGDRIYLREDHGAVRRTLAHELVHLLLGSSWAPLPPAAEEGLCDLVASEIVPGEEEYYSRRLVQLLLGLDGVAVRLVGRHPDVPELPVSERLILRPTQVLDPRTVFKAGAWYKPLTRGGSPLHYACGYFVISRVIDRLGFEGLHELCTSEERDLLPIETLLAAADLPEDPSAWWPVIAGSLADRELRALGELVSTMLAAKVKDLAAFHGWPDDELGFLSAFALRLSADGSDTGVPLASVPGVLRLLDDAEVE